VRVLVLGATGAIGRRVVPRLVACGHQVTGSGRSSARLSALEREGAQAVAVDLLDPGQVYAALAGQDAVVNPAARVPSGARALLPSAWRATARLRREGPEILVAAALARGVAYDVVDDTPVLRAVLAARDASVERVADVRRHAEVAP
jgi:nucleoside-diphosphate-sugar epimerase